jgi:hypothetical protein
MCYGVKLPNFKLKTQPKQLLASLPLYITFPNQYYLCSVTQGESLLQQAQAL